MRRRTGRGWMCALAILVAGAAHVSPAAAAAGRVPTQIAVADGPHGALLGMLDSDGNVWAKFLNAPSWTLEFSGGQKQIALADGPHGPVLGRLDAGGTFWVKAGGLSARWVQEQTGVQRIAVADGGDGPMAGYVDGSGTFFAKVGGLSTAWTHMYGGGTGGR